MELDQNKNIYYSFYGLLLDSCFLTLRKPRARLFGLKKVVYYVEQLGLNYSPTDILKS